MESSIVISKPAPVYHPGDSVSGSVHLTAISGSTIKKVKIDFYGSAKTRAGGVSPYHQHVNLILQREQTLHSESEILNPGLHEWPFSFTIPERCEQHRSQALFTRKDTFFNGSSGQSLPPSFEDIANLKLLSAVNRTGDEEAIIRYSFKASFFDVHGNEVKPITSIIPLNIQPRRNLEHPTWDTTTHVCRFKIPLQGRRRASLTNIFTNRKGDNQEDAVGFSLRARIATTLIVGKPIPIFLLLEHDILEDAPGPRSTSSIRSITVTLLSSTSIRGYSPIRVQHPTGESQSTWETSKQIGSKLTYSVAIQNGGILDIRSLIPDLIVPDSQTPSFATFNIVHIHSLKLKVELMHQDQSYTARYIIKRVILLPATHKPPTTTPPPQNPDPDPKDQNQNQDQTQPTTSLAPPIFSSTYTLRHSVDDELESAHADNPPSFEAALSSAPPSHPQTENPPSFETAVSSADPRQSGRPLLPPPFEASHAPGPVGRRMSLHHGMTAEEGVLFDGVGEEELPGYAREETY